MNRYNLVLPNDHDETSTELLLETASLKVSKPYLTIEKKVFITKTIFAVALLQCFVLLFYQQEHTKQGLMAFPLQMSATTATSLAWPLALLDLFVSITATNLDHADKIFTESDANLDAIKTMMFVVQAVSWFSYLISSVPAGIPLLQLLDKTNLLTQRSIIPFIAIIFSIPGAVFYALYNIKNLLTTFNAVRKWWENPLKPLQRILDRPVYLLHYLEAFLRYIAVVGSRTATAIFVVQLLSPLCLTPYPISAKSLNSTTLSLMIMIGIATFINVSMTRVITNLTKLISVKFDAITEEQYKCAEAVAHSETGAKFEAVVTHLSSAITASGFALYASYGASKAEWELSAATLSTAIIVGGLMFAKSIYVKHAATVYAYAVKEQEKQLQNRVFLLDDRQELSEKAQRELLEKHFSALTETFESAYVKWFILLFDFCSCSAKALSFYSFLMGLSAKLAPLGHAFSTQELLALCLILAPESFKNSFILNQRLMNDSITSYLAKYAMESRQVNSTWLIVRMVQVYFKSPRSFDLTIIQEMVAARKQLLESTAIVEQGQHSPVSSSEDGLRSQSYFSLSSDHSRDSCVSVNSRMTQHSAVI